jgi:hypothetical protein
MLRNVGKFLAEVVLYVIMAMRTWNSSKKDVKREREELNQSKQKTQVYGINPVLLPVCERLSFLKYYCVNYLNYIAVYEGGW